jgi:hypothetical protein
VLLTSQLSCVNQATYEKEPDSAKATPELVSFRAESVRDFYSLGLQLQKNLFETPYAHALLAVSGSLAQPGEPVALALYFFNFSTWTGRPGLYVSTWVLSPIAWHIYAR